MNTVSVDIARSQFDDLVARVLSDAAPTEIALPDGTSVVVMPMEEFTAWQETHYLLQSPSNAAHLHKSISELRSGDLEEQPLVDP